MNFGNRLLSKIQRSSRLILYTLGLEKFLYKSHRKRDLVLMFHNVLSETSQDINLRNIGVDYFQNMMKYISKNYEIVPLADLKNPGSGRIAITFDDGLINNLRYAAPVLKKLNLPATFFATTTWINGEACIWPDEVSLILSSVQHDVEFNGEIFRKSSFNQFRSLKNGQRLDEVLTISSQSKVDEWMRVMRQSSNYDVLSDTEREDAWRIMKGEEIKILAGQKGIEIGSHGVTHRNMTLLSDDELMFELIESKKYLEQVTGKTVNAFAFPFGAYSDASLKMARQAGYSLIAGVNAANVLSTKVDVPKRVGVYNDLSLTENLHFIQKSMI